VIQSKLTFRDLVSEFVSEEAATISDLTGSSRKIEGKLCPRTMEDVVQIVKAAKKQAVKLHAFSCGKNWGFGSSLPYSNEAWLVDLGGMTQIKDYDPECGVVRIEPGVTQGQLYRALEKDGADWFFNITGAGQSTSVLGNALERGIGYYGQRQHDLLEMQVVTGTGDIISTRLGQTEGGESGAALGTDITQLFCQGNFGIVISARLRLLRRTDGGGVIIARLRDEAQQDNFFGRILSLKKEGCIAGVPHVGNRERIVSTMAPWLPAEHARAFSEKAPTWTAALPLLGRRELVDSAAKVIQASMTDICDMEVLIGKGMADVHQTGPSPVEQLQQLACGFPSNLALPGVQWSALGQADLSRLDPEATAAGLIHVTPALRSSVADIRRSVALIRKSAQSLDLPDLAITVNIVDSLTTVMVISVPFAREDAAVAQEKAQGLQTAVRNAGLGFYRFGLLQGDGLRPAARAVKRIHAKLKRTFDPHGIFAPSRYDVLFSELTGVSPSQSSLALVKP
jgi:4-cresol dehydrogenase (hydroxylating) flavoprotein subunit